MYRIIISAFVLSGAFGEIIRNSPCDFSEITYVRYLNITGMAGAWNQLARIKNSVESGSCSTLTIAVHEEQNGLHVELTNREVIEKKEHVNKGQIVPKVESPGQFSMQYQNVSFQAVVLATDYSNYALIYSCNSVAENTSSVFAWIYSKSLSLQQVQQNVNFTEVLNGINDLKNATWINPQHTKEACEVSAGTAFRFTPIFAILTMLVMSKDFTGAN